MKNIKASPDAISPDPVLGTMTFGKEVDERSADGMVGCFLDQGFDKIDTANIYSEGRSEEILGKILTHNRRKKIRLATKVNPWSEGGLRPTRLLEQVETSLRRLKSDYVDLLYLHSPDLHTPLEATLEACEKLFREGKFRELGLSNYAAWQVADAWHICRRNAWVLPTVYQGMYNSITRDVERELFPSIRSFGIRFYAYNPLAGGLLTGKHIMQSVEPQKGRFTLYPKYMERYWKSGQFDALDVIRSACAANNITMTECALRWLKYHSFLKGNEHDGIIIGAKNRKQLEENITFFRGKELPDAVKQSIDLAWETSAPSCPQYFRT
jgi:aflatoxin B1 aldehyde reductase